MLAMLQTSLQLRPEMTLLYLKDPASYEPLMTKIHRFKVVAVYPLNGRARLILLLEQGQDGHIVAIQVLQRQFRRVLAQLAKQRQEKQRAAVAVVSATWAMRIRARALRRQALGQVSQRWTANQRRVEQLLCHWKATVNQPHVAVVLLSISGSKQLRQQ